MSANLRTWLCMAVLVLAGCPPTTAEWEARAAERAAKSSPGQVVPVAWERIESVAPHNSLTRSRTPTGWLVMAHEGNSTGRSALMFVPDPEHQWLNEGAQ